MKVACLSGISRSAGGLFYAVISLCKSLQRQGLDLEVLGRFDHFFEEDQDVWNPVRVRPYKAIGPLGSSCKVRGFLRNSCFDLVHQHGLWLDDQWAALQWQRKTGKPVVISPHGMLDPWALRNSGWKKKIVGYLFVNESLQSATCIHALCRAEADSIRAYGLMNPIAIIPNGVELPEIEEHGAGRMAQGAGDGKKRLLFLGRIHPKKGLKELIQAWAKAQNLKPKALSEWQLVIAGWDDGGHLDGLQKSASEMGLEWSNGPNPQADICFCGPVFGEDKESLLNTVDAFVLPSHSEGLPMSVLEAWSRGLPVLMTEACNLPEGFDTAAAVRIDLAPDSLMNGLIQFLGMNESALAEMGTRGRALVEQRFTWDRIARDMLAVYEWCAGGDKPACILDD